MSKSNNILVALGVLAFGGLLYGVYRYFNKDYQSKLTGNALQDRAIMFADRLYAAMNIFGTDENEIKLVFENIQDNAEFARVVNAFGVRPYKDWNHAFPDWLYPQTNLIQQLHEELSSSALAELNQILAGNGITSTV